MNWEIIIAVGIAVLGWLANHWLAIRAQNKSFRNQIINDARLDITKSIRDYQDWLLRFEALFAAVRFAIIHQESGYNINWIEIINKVRDEFHSDKSFMYWIARLKEYELLFTITKECSNQLVKRHNQIYEVTDSIMQGLILADFEAEALIFLKRELEEANKNLLIVRSQFALMEDLLIYSQNYSLSFITGKRIPEREPRDPSLPRLYIDEKGYLQYKEGTEL